MNKNKRSDEKRMEEKLEERRTKKKYMQERFIFQIRDFFLKRKVQKEIAPISIVSQKMFLDWKRKRDNSREKDERAKTENEKKQFAMENRKNFYFSFKNGVQKFVLFV